MTECDRTAAALDRAVALHRAGRLAEAERAYRALLAERPDMPELLHALGVLAAQARDPAQAVALIGRAVALNPRMAAWHSNLGAALRLLGQRDQAALALARAIALDPGLADAHANLGAVRHDLGRYPEALTALRCALARQPDHRPALISLGAVLRDTGRPDLALAPLTRAIALEPNDGEAHWTLATTLLVAGRFEQGWPEFEWRWRRPGLQPRRMTAPRWQGEPLTGRTLLLHAEQGRGDTLQFVRYAPLLHARGATVILQCQTELTRLLAGVPGVARVVPADAAEPPCDCHLPMMSLPVVLRTGLATIPAQVPYLAVAAEAVERWRGRLAALVPQARLRVGLVWAGTPTHGNDHNRSLPLASLRPLFGLPGVGLYSLQVGRSRSELVEAGPEAPVDLAGFFADFADTAACIRALDLVISVDTAAAHLAGGLACPVWVLLPFAPDWRWLQNRVDSPWYPTAHLFRQPRPGDWAAVVQAVRERLADRFGRESLGDQDDLSAARGRPGSRTGEGP